MRIISDFHDYYDVIQKYNPDSSLIYIRKSKKEKVKLNDFFSKETLRKVTPVHYAEQILVGFCNNFFKLTKHKNLNNLTKDDLSFDIEITIALINRFWSYPSKYNIEKARNFFSYNFNLNICTLEHPIFLINFYESTIEYNPRLNLYEFYRVLPAYEAYHKLSGFLESFAQPCKPIPSISDETMVEIKGFDKYSFRKEKKIGNSY